MKRERKREAGQRNGAEGSSGEKHKKIDKRKKTNTGGDGRNVNFYQAINVILIHSKL